VDPFSADPDEGSVGDQAKKAIDEARERRKSSAPAFMPWTDKRPGESSNDWAHRIGRKRPGEF